MAAYVDFVVSPIRKDRLEDYRKLAEVARAVFLDAGALTYVEYIGDDVPYGELTSLPRAVQASDDEILVVSYITYGSRAERDAASAKMEADPRMADAMGGGGDMVGWKRMIFGGFVPFVGE